MRDQVQGRLPGRLKCGATAGCSRHVPAAHTFGYHPQAWQFRSCCAAYSCGWLSGNVGTCAPEPPSGLAGCQSYHFAAQAMQIGALRMQRKCRHSARSWIVLCEQTQASRKCSKSGMSAKLTLTNCAWKNVWRRRRRTCITLHAMAIGIGATVAPVGISRGFKRESTILTEMDK